MRTSEGILLVPYFMQDECVGSLPIDEQPSDLQPWRDLECVCWTIFLCSITVQAENIRAFIHEIAASSLNKKGVQLQGGKILNKSCPH